ncbi:hypothetical protein KGQ20_42450 [Catenulispora sp. NF23]|uniref:hypothetical protein n=1 Tax=Catenulispora pinistramenti TaxID=2705254 RepID=UPI001BA91FAF|nr:hypothetical protein [Catenulispora pinistramenti]MBS2539426.1 hypothetical protein [Catenulispora pinistramenti]
MPAPKVLETNPNNTSNPNNRNNNTNNNYNNNPGEWDPNSVHRPPPTDYPTGAGPTPPAVPGSDGGPTGDVRVNTPSLELFAQNIASLIPTVRQALVALDDVNVQPGAFYHADQIRTNINGVNGDAGLKNQLELALNDLINGLQNLHDDVMQLSQKYQSFDDLNTATADDLANRFNDATQYFDNIMTDTGGCGGGGNSGQ